MYPFGMIENRRKLSASTVGDGALDVPFRIPVGACYRRGGYQPPVSCGYDPALAGGRLPPLPQRVRFIVGDGALDVPFRMPSIPVHECRDFPSGFAPHPCLPLSGEVAFCLGKKPEG